jgi:hypothetical protein
VDNKHLVFYSTSLAAPRNTLIPVLTLAVAWNTQKLYAILGERATSLRKLRIITHEHAKTWIGKLH